MQADFIRLMVYGFAEEAAYYANLHKQGGGSVGLDDCGTLIHVAPDGSITEIESAPESPY